MIKQLFSTFIVTMIMTLTMNTAYAADDDEEFAPAYQNEGKYKLEDPDKYFTHKDGRLYYTSGKKNGIRVNENDVESTDETIGYLAFVISPATLVYMNLIGFWE